MNILIVGCGYLGQRAALLWTSASHHVTALTRTTERARELATLGIQPVIGDVLDPATLTPLGKFDLCLYAVSSAGEQRGSKHDVYVQGLSNVLLQLAGKVPRLLYVSSTSVYGQDQGEWIDATSLTNPTSDGGRICLEAEQRVRESAGAAKGMSAIILRLAGIYGPHRLIGRTAGLLAGTPLTGNPQAWLNLIHVDDAVQVVNLLAQRWTPEPFETMLLCDQEPVRRYQFYAELARLIQAPDPTYSGDSAGLNKRCDSRPLTERLGYQFLYPGYRAGLQHALSNS